MILAEDEVAAGERPRGHDGARRRASRPARRCADVLAIRDDVLELEITPNRPDCLGVYGVAREVHAVTGAPLAPPPWAEDPGADGSGTAPTAITVDRRATPTSARASPRRVFEDVTIGPVAAVAEGAPEAAGQRPISNVVDITNYVMLLTGQPLHAFDLDRVAGRQLDRPRGAPTARRSRRSTARCARSTRDMG